jgi:hypothetical protein
LGFFQLQNVIRRPKFRRETHQIHTLTKLAGIISKNDALLLNEDRFPILSYFCQELGIYQGAKKYK